MKMAPESLINPTLAQHVSLSYCFNLTHWKNNCNLKYYPTRVCKLVVLLWKPISAKTRYILQ